MTVQEYKNLTLREFDAAAEKFDDNDPSVYNLCRKDYPDLLAELISEPCKDILDCGCGTGAMLSMIREKCPDKNYTGIDLSEKMIEVANRRAGENLRFVRGDCENLPFGDGSFDAVLCSMSFHHYPNPDRFFQSVHRILRKDGRLILRDMTSNSRLMMWFINHIELPIIRTVFHKGDVHCYNRAEIAALCQQSGLVMERFEIRKGFRMHCVCRKQEKDIKTLHEGGIS